MRTGDYRYQPKGRMCANCKYKHRDCSHLPFNEMPVIEDLKSYGIFIVKCTDFTKEE